MQKPTIPKGMRDFDPVELARRNYIFDTIKSVYHSYGFQQIETPAMEQLSTLLGKYGDEGDRLLFKVLNSGDYFKGLEDKQLLDREVNSLSTKICEKGLRYDLTVPFARYVVMHRNELTFPFKRFQIQPVWRADRPQKGRYREFYQCDADIIGSKSLLNEVELLQIINDVFVKLGVQTDILLNNRKILAGIAEVIGQEERLIDITVAIDKLDKIGLEKVKEELVNKGFATEDVERLEPILMLQGTNEEKLCQLSKILANSEQGLKGIEELTYIIERLKYIQMHNPVTIDLSLARGLSYYTGAILEVKARDVSIGSISGGGRYDDLTGIFGLKDMSGVGISFGADRIYDVMMALDLFPKNFAQIGTEVLCVNFGDESNDALFPIITKLRQEGIRVELYPDEAKMKKQLSYANNHSIPFVVLLGEDELKNGSVTIKDMELGEQTTLKQNELITYLLSKR